MSDESGAGAAEHGPVGRELSTSVHGNSTAFGFSITVTGTFGVLSTLEGSPSLHEILLFGMAGAVAVALLEGLVTKGFRVPASEATSEVQMLGTAMNFASVAAGIAAAMALGEIAGGTIAWPLGGFGAALVFMLGESGEILLAEGVQRLRGDPRAGAEKAE